MHSSGTLNIVLRTQQQWSNMRVAGCRINKIDKVLRIKVPAILEEYGIGKYEGDYKEVGEEETAVEDYHEQVMPEDVLISGMPIAIC